MSLLSSCWSRALRTSSDIPPEETMLACAGTRSTMTCSMTWFVTVPDVCAVARDAGLVAAVAREVDAGGVPAETRTETAPPEAFAEYRGTRESGNAME